MQLVSTIKGQALRFGVPKTPDSFIFLPDFIARLREEFRFVDGPSAAEDYNLDSGVLLGMGTHSGAMIHAMKVYGNGILVEGPVSTDLLDAALDAAEAILGDEFGAQLERPPTAPRLYTSQLEVRPSIAAVQALNELDAARARLRDLVSAYGVDVPEYRVIGFTMGADPELSSTAAKPGKFLFERRANKRFEENLFFSDAPLRSVEHLAFLMELEATLTSA